MRIEEDCVMRREWCGGAVASDSYSQAGAVSNLLRKNTQIHSLPFVYHFYRYRENRGSKTNSCFDVRRASYPSQPQPGMSEVSHIAFDISAPPAASMRSFLA